MNTLIVYAHPNLKSFNAAILRTVVSSLKDLGHPFSLKILYAEDFQSVLTMKDLENIMNPDSTEIAPDILSEQSEIKWASKLIFIYPIWWFDCPAILKGWVERVFIRGFSHTVKDDDLIGLLELEKVLILQTTGSSKEAIQEKGAFNIINQPMLYWAMNLLGVQNIECETFWGVSIVSATEREEMLRVVKHRIKDF